MTSCIAPSLAAFISGVVAGIFVCFFLILGVARVASLLSAATGWRLPSRRQISPSIKAKITNVLETLERYKIDEQYTAAEKLFGKDDEAGQPLEPGVFTREQVAILVAVHMGTLPGKALKALAPESGKPEAVSSMQAVTAMAYLTPEIVSDIIQIVDEIRDTERPR